MPNMKAYNRAVQLAAHMVLSLPFHPGLIPRCYSTPSSSCSCSQELQAIPSLFQIQISAPACLGEEWREMGCAGWGEGKGGVV